MSVTLSNVEYLKSILDGEVQYHRAIVELSNLNKREQNVGKTDRDIPLVERLEEFPVNGINLANIVVYPPVLEAAPIRPLFFDVAWNYLKYPGNQTNGNGKSVQGSSQISGGDGSTKRGWFGLGL